jgi:uncharacterized membrane protein YczE
MMPCALIINTLTDMFCELAFKFISILLYYLGDSLYLFTTEAIIRGQFYVGFQPEFGFTLGFCDMYMNTFFLIGEDFKYKAVLAPEYGTHNESIVN